MINKEKEKLQLEAYKLIGKAITNTYAPLADSIIRNKRYLERADLVQDIYICFHEKDYVNKFDPSKGKLSSFVYRFVFWNLNTIRRHKDNPEILFSELGYIGDDGEYVEYEIPDFNDPETILLDKSKEKNIKQLREYVLGGK